jgi:hypothetical protein
MTALLEKYWLRFQFFLKGVFSLPVSNSSKNNPYYWELDDKDDEVEFENSFDAKYNKFNKNNVDEYVRQNTIDNTNCSNNVDNNIKNNNKNNAIEENIKKISMESIQKGVHVSLKIAQHRQHLQKKIVMKKTVLLN